MSISGPLVILAVAALLLFLIVQQWRRSRPSKAPAPECSLDMAWDHYIQNAGEWPQRDQQAIATLTGGRFGDAAGLRERLEGLIDSALGTEEPLVPIRQAIMDATDRFVMLETMTPASATVSDEETDGTQLAISESVLERGALRCFSKLRYADFSDNDWYTHYLRLAEMHATNVSAMVAATVRGQPASLETSLHEPLTHAMARARKALLHHPRQEPVDRSTHLDEASGIRAPTPSAAQIEDLSAVMKEHFQDLFTARIYGIGENNPATPAAAVQVDAILLYNMLSLEFSQPNRAWRQIMEIGLGGDAEALHGEDALLQSAARALQAWQDNEQSEPFEAALQSACTDAVAASNPDHAEILATCMRDDIRELARRIRAITRNDRESGGELA